LVFFGTRWWMEGTPIKMWWNWLSGWIDWLMFQIHRVGKFVIYSWRTSSTVPSLSRSSYTKLHSTRIRVRRRRIRHQQTSRPQGRRRWTKVSRRLSQGWHDRGSLYRKVHWQFIIRSMYISPETSLAVGACKADTTLATGRYIVSDGLIQVKFPGADVSASAYRP